MGRIKIKHNLDPGDSRIKLKLLELLAPTKINVCKLTTTNDGSLLVVTSTEADADRLLDNKIVKTLNDAGFDPILPPELRARRTVICHRVDELIFENSTQDIAEEIEEKQTWAKVIRTFKFPSSNKHICTLKIEFADADMASKAASDGLRMFKMSIASHQIAKETYVQLTTCMKCYAIEEHTTSSCPLPAEHRKCSECAGSDHTWRECKSGIKKCLNCQGAHRTLAMTCKLRKDAIRKKQQGLQNTQNTKNYALAAASTTATNNQDPAQIGLLSSTIPTIWFSYFYALTMDAVSPGCFQNVLNSTLAANNLPSMTVPQAPPSRDIIKTMMNTCPPFTANAHTTGDMTLTNQTTSTLANQTTSTNTQRTPQTSPPSGKTTAPQVPQHKATKQSNTIKQCWEEMSQDHTSNNEESDATNSPKTSYESESDCSSVTIGSPKTPQDLQKDEEEEDTQTTTPVTTGQKNVWKHNKSRTQDTGQVLKRPPVTTSSSTRPQHQTITEHTKPIRTLRSKQQ